MATEIYNLIRLAIPVNSTNSPIVPGQTVNVLTGAVPAFYGGSDVQFQLGFFQNLGTAPTIGGIGSNALGLDLSNVASVQLDIKDPNSYFSAPSLFTLVVPAASFQTPGVIVNANWQSGFTTPAPAASNPSWQNLFVNMTNQASNFNFQVNRSLVLVLSGITTASPSTQVVYGATAINFWPNPLGFTGAPPANSPSYYTTAQSDARYPVVVQNVTNGNGAAALGANCPALNPNAPANWVQVTVQGQGGPFTMFIPGWI